MQRRPRQRESARCRDGGWLISPARRTRPRKQGQRAEGAAVQRSAEKKKQRENVAREERDSHDARQHALADLKKKRAEAAPGKWKASLVYVRYGTSSGKRKAPPSSAASKKQKKTTNPHKEDADDEADESLQSTSVYVVML
ncbi:hypothetical protein ON010_g260 [Phytophthora cinnamomi]|nr:hypothetical protein ON010_g260 [Phytophthora cinnamomi]